MTRSSLLSNSNNSSGSNGVATQCFGEISELLDHLYLSAAHVIKPDVIRKKQINFIVNATIEEPNLYFKNGDYLKIRISDHPYARIDVYFDVVADKIKANKENGGKTLVHCVAGVSRSTSLCLAYLIKYENMTLRTAYKHVKGIRPIIRPNCGFWRQLIDYEARLLGKSSVKMVESKWGPEEPVPDLYVDEIKETSNGIGLGSGNPNGPQIVRTVAITYNVPKYFATRSKSDYAMPLPVKLQQSPTLSGSSTLSGSGLGGGRLLTPGSGLSISSSSTPISNTTTISFGPNRLFSNLKINRSPDPYDSMISSSSANKSSTLSSGSNFLDGRKSLLSNTSSSLARSPFRAL